MNNYRKGITLIETLTALIILSWLIAFSSKYITTVLNHSYISSNIEELLNWIETPTQNISESYFQYNAPKSLVKINIQWQESQFQDYQIAVIEGRLKTGKKIQWCVYVKKEDSP